jgi:hypothetical protein
MRFLQDQRTLTVLTWIFCFLNGQSISISVVLGEVPVGMYRGCCSWRARVQTAG